MLDCCVRAFVCWYHTCGVVLSIEDDPLRKFFIERSKCVFVLERRAKWNLKGRKEEFLGQQSRIRRSCFGFSAVAFPKAEFRHSFLLFLLLRSRSTQRLMSNQFALCISLSVCSEGLSVVGQFCWVVFFAYFKMPQMNIDEPGVYQTAF